MHVNNARESTVYLNHPDLDEDNFTHIRFDETIERLAESLEDDEFASAFANELIDMGFLTAPASTRHHLAYAGGLADHSLNVVKALEGMLWNAPDFTHRIVAIPIIVGLCHDLCKVDCYVERDCGFAWGGHALGDALDDYEHGALSRRRAARILDKTWARRDQVLSDDEFDELLDAIEFHMGLYEPKMLRADDPRDAHDTSIAIEMRSRFLEASDRSQLVVITHLADMWATHIFER